MRDYIARNPKTGKPLRTGRKRRKHLDLAYKPVEGAWDAIHLDRILPLARGDVEIEPVIWSDKERLMRQPDGIRALPRIRGRDQLDAHEALEGALGSLDTRLRIAGLESLPYCALLHTENLFEHLHELLEDIDVDVQKAAQKCLIIVAPVFPSVTEETMRRELRLSDKVRRRSAFDALKQVADSWPEVAELHIDELIREEEGELRGMAAALLSRLAKHKSATLWDLIGWCLQDEAVVVRRHAARALIPLANHAPKVTQIALEIAFFDDDEAVRNSALKASKKLDPNSFRMQRLITDGTRHSDRNIRMSCIKMLPIIMVDAESRILATELLQQETDSEIQKLLEEMMIDESLEGTEAERNAYLAPAEKVERDEGSLATPPPVMMSPEKEAEPKSPSKLPDPIRRPSQDEIFYGDDFDDETDDFL
ncbi:MAG: HEAT repeat domain-containing protein [Candidatus Thalassarchaeaceae archaeon]|nr:HEAT repeat domain-containing protein [Candidatus Thalassarchaeaceae archaeon]